MCTVWRCCNNSQIEENEAWTHGEHKKSDTGEQPLFSCIQNMVPTPQSEQKTLKLSSNNAFLPSTHNNNKDSSLWSWTTKSIWQRTNIPFRERHFRTDSKDVCRLSGSRSIKAQSARQISFYRIISVGRHLSPFRWLTLHPSCFIFEFKWTAMVATWPESMSTPL